MDENRQSGSNLDNDRRWTVCDYCSSELALDDVELEQGWYMCPECDQLSHLVEIVGDSPDYSQRVGPEVVADVEAVEDGPKAKPRESDAEWVKLKTATGPEEAALEVSYLRANGIEAVAWQEGAGRAFGLTLGSLGASHIMVREDQEQLARSILEAEAEGSSDYDGADNDSISDASKAVLGLTAVVPIRLGPAWLSESPRLCEGATRMQARIRLIVSTVMRLWNCQTKKSNKGTLYVQNVSIRFS